MRIQALGHVVLRVRDLARAEAFYHELLGIPISARAPEWSMTFLTLGEHHDLALCALGPQAIPATEKTLGLDHVAFRIAGGLEALAAAKARLDGAGVESVALDHVVSHSLYVRDPDGNQVEVYVNGTEAWREDPSLILSESAGLRLPETAPARVAREERVAVHVAKSAHAERVAYLVRAFRDHLRAPAPTDVQLEVLVPRLLAEPSLEFAYAERDGEPVGYTQTRIYPSLWAPGTEALLEDLFVLAPVRGSGVGRKLLRHALERARERGARLLGLTTNERNRAAQSLYRAEGLRPQSARIWENGREIRWVVELGRSAG